VSVTGVQTCALPIWAKCNYCHIIFFVHTLNVFVQVRHSSSSDRRTRRSFKVMPPSCHVTSSVNRCLKFTGTKMASNNIYWYEYWLLHESIYVIEGRFLWDSDCNVTRKWNARAQIITNYFVICFELWVDISFSLRQLFAFQITLIIIQSQTWWQ